jgi:hypothetical protein
LFCPFGCSEESRRQKSIKRSSDYYRSNEGKIKKKALNKKRSLKNNENNKKVLNFNSKKILFYIRFIFLILDKINHHLGDLEIIYDYFLKILRQHPLFLTGKIMHIPDD